MSLRDVLTAIFRTATAPASPTPLADMTSTTTKPLSIEETVATQISLYKVSNTQWVVMHAQCPASFTTVDKACDNLMTLGVIDEQIDLALIDMAVRGNGRAAFSEKGIFMFSDEAGFYS